MPWFVAQTTRQADGTTYHVVANAPLATRAAAREHVRAWHARATRWPVNRETGLPHPTTVVVAAADPGDALRRLRGDDD